MLQQQHVQAIKLVQPVVALTAVAGPMRQLGASLHV